MSKSGERSQTFQHIIDASLQLFNQEGERVITTNHIAERMNISTGKLYYHFRNKEEIISELYQRYVKGMAEQLSAALKHSNSIEAMVGAMEKRCATSGASASCPRACPACTTCTRNWRKTTSNCRAASWPASWPSCFRGCANRKCCRATTSSWLTWSSISRWCKPAG